MKKSWHQKFTRSPKERRTTQDGILFPSIGEMERWEKLKLWQLAGEIRNLRRQVKFPLQRGDLVIRTEKGEVMHYTADFVYDRMCKIPGCARCEDGDRWEQVIEEFKGFKGRVEMLRIAVFEALYGVKVKIVRK